MNRQDSDERPVDRADELAAILAGERRVLEQILQGAPLPSVLELLTVIVEEHASERLLATILLLDPDGVHLRPVAGQRVPAEWSRVITPLRIGPAVGSCGTAAHRGTPVIVTDIATDPLWKGFSDEALRHGLRACWSTPILSSTKTVLGTFAIYYSTPRSPSRHELDLVDMVTRTASLAIERQRSDTHREQLLKELREEREVLATVHRIALALSAELELEKLVQATTDAARELSTAQFAAFFYNVTADDGESYALYTLSGVPKERFSRFPMPRNTEIFGPTFRGEGVIRLDDVTADPRYGRNAPYHGMPSGHLPVRSYLAVPVISRSAEVLGGIFLGHELPGVFLDKHERVLVSLAAQIAIAIDNARLYEAAKQARQTAEVDRKRAEAVARELERSQAALQEKVADLERFHDVVVGRELRLIELERENAELKAQLDMTGGSHEQRKQVTP